MPKLIETTTVKVLHPVSDCLTNDKVDVCLEDDKIVVRHPDDMLQLINLLKFLVSL